MLNEQEIKELLKRMSEKDKDVLILMINKERQEQNNNEYSSKLQNNFRCPYCHSNDTCKNGSNNKNGKKTQKFRCNHCHKNYSLHTNTIFYYSKKDINTWREYIELFSQGLTLRQIVKKMDGKIKLQTAFFWRHKILEVMKHFDNHDKLDGIIEADETYFEESQKGSRNVKGRKPRKRVYSSEYRQAGLSSHKVCVLTALDRQKHSFNKPVGYGKVNKSQIEILQNRIEKDSVLITDGDSGYRTIKDVKLKQLKFGKPQSKVYHMNNINNFHSKLKQFMIRFNGVATKYLDNYVNYFREVRDNIDIFSQLLNIQGYYRVVDIRNRKICFENGFNM